MQDAPGANAKNAGDSDKTDFFLCDLKKGAEDKLGNIIIEILWIERDYAIYSSDKGIYVHFSDNPEQEKTQRKQFTNIVPELCELRYLTTAMKRRSWLSWSNWLPSLSSEPRHNLYDHNMAQALMLAMAGEVKLAKQLAESTLKLAVRRVTSDNTIRYIGSCIVWALGLILIGVVAAVLLLPYFGDTDARWRPYVVGGIFGALGAVFSIATRAQALKLKPCDESRMNFWMGGVRVVIGVMSAIVLLLVADTLLTDMLGKFMGLSEKKFSTHPAGRGDAFFWPALALLGFVGGFAERLIPNILRLTTDQIESAAGTPVQLARTSTPRPGQDGSSDTSA